MNTDSANPNAASSRMAKPAHAFLPDATERQALADHGILRIPLDTPYQSEPVNVYVVLGDPITLIDGGLRYRDNLDKIADALAEHGHTLDDIGEIWLTHTHIDHFGLARDIAALSQATIRAWSGAADRIERYHALWPDDRAAFGRLVASIGAPEHVIQSVYDAPNQSHTYASPIQIHQTIEPHEHITLAGRFSCQLLHTPGHSPWCTSFWLPDPGLLFSGDALLKRVRFTVLLYPEEPQPLPQGYLAYPNTLRTLHQLPIQRNLPGHGPSFTDTHSYIERTMRQHRRRQQQIAAWLDDGPMQPFAIAQQLFGDAITQQLLLLVTSEIVAHLQWLLHEGTVICHNKDGQRWYARSHIADKESPA